MSETQASVDPQETQGVSRTTVPHEARLARTANGWEAHLAVRADHVEVGKQVVVREEIVVRSLMQPDQVKISENVQREELKVKTQGQVEIVDRSEPKLQ